MSKIIYSHKHTTITCLFTDQKVASQADSGNRVKHTHHKVPKTGLSFHNQLLDQNCLNSRQNWCLLGFSGAESGCDLHAKMQDVYSLLYHIYIEHSLLFL